jgi:hypothetical protein
MPFFDGAWGRVLFQAARGPFQAECEAMTVSNARYGEETTDLVFLNSV